MVGPSPPYEVGGRPHVSKDDSPCKAKESGETAALFRFARTFRVYRAVFCCRSLSLTQARQAVRQKPYSVQLWLIVAQTFYDVRLVFAHRAFCASEIFLRAAAERVRFSFFGFVCKLVRRRPTKPPMTWITWSSRSRSFSSSFNTPARFAMYSPLMLFEITARPYYRSTGTNPRLSTLRSSLGNQFARDAVDTDALHCPLA
jgi:hypothetical protein